MSINIQGLLNQYEGRCINILQDEEGNTLTDEQARLHLRDLQSQGHKKMCCSSDCDGFDPFDKGCPGHPIAEKAITIKQPYASLIVSGIKEIENRTWKTNFRGRIFVHAGADYPYVDLTDEQEDPICGDLRYNFIKRRFPISAIIGEVDIIDCVQNHPSIWAEHKATKIKTVDGVKTEVEVPVWNWVLANPVKYDQPIINVMGALSFWEFKKLKLK